MTKVIKKKKLMIMIYQASKKYIIKLKIFPLLLLKDMLLRLKV